MERREKKDNAKDTSVLTTARLSRQTPGRASREEQRARPSPRERSLPRHPAALSQAWLPCPAGSPAPASPAAPGLPQPGAPPGSGAPVVPGGAAAVLGRGRAGRRPCAACGASSRSRRSRGMGGCWDSPAPALTGGTEQREWGSQRAADRGRGGGRCRREGTRSPSRGGTAAQAGRCRWGPRPLAAGRRAVTDLSAGAW